MTRSPGPRRDRHRTSRLVLALLASLVVLVAGACSDAPTEKEIAMADDGIDPSIVPIFTSENLLPAVQQLGQVFLIDHPGTTFQYIAKDAETLGRRVSDGIRDSKTERRTPASTHASASRMRTASATAVIGVLAPRLTTRQDRACSIAPNSSRGRSCRSCGGQASTTVRDSCAGSGRRSSPSTPRNELETKCSCSTPSSPRSQPSPTSRSTGMTTSATVMSTPCTSRHSRSASRTPTPSSSRGRS